MKTCDVETRAKVIAFQEGIDPTDVECPVKEFCHGNNCVFIRDGHGEVFISDEIKLMKIREELKKYGGK